MLFIIIQFIPNRLPANITEDGRSITGSSLVTSTVLDLLKKSCFDCHSFQVQYPWYARVAPSSWLLSAHINKGTEHLNFSEWEDYSKREKIGLLDDIKNEIESGKMPLRSYLLIHRDSRLNSENISTLSGWCEEATAIIIDK